MKLSRKLTNSAVDTAVFSEMEECLAAFTEAVLEAHNSGAAITDSYVQTKREGGGHPKYVYYFRAETKLEEVEADE